MFVEQPRLHRVFKIDYVDKPLEILNLEGHRIILPIGRVASGRVYACNMRSRLVFLTGAPIKYKYNITLSL